jgi:hypothetical protein
MIHILKESVKVNQLGSRQKNGEFFKNFRIND